MSKNIIIIGAGPAGLTAGYEILKRHPGNHVIVLEAEDAVGGIAKTINHNGMRLDIGGHRYFSNDSRVVKWWEDMCGSDLQTVHRISDVLYNGKLFHYPIVLKWDLLVRIGVRESIHVLLSYFAARFKKREEKSLKDLYINRFGKRLFEIFFSDYTKKVVGRTADQISPEWGRRRVGSVSINRVISNYITKRTRIHPKTGSKIEASLTDFFYYPKHGSGEMWAKVADKIREKNGEILLNRKVSRLILQDGIVKQVLCDNGECYNADIIISSMPLRDLLYSISDTPKRIKKIADELHYRSFVTVGLLIPMDSIIGTKLMSDGDVLIPDQWIYIQDSLTRLGRIQLINNWSKELNCVPNSIGLSLEYFCFKEDAAWSQSKEAWINQASYDLKRLSLIEKDFQAIDAFVIYCEKAYPCYWGGFYNLNEVQEYLSQIQNLFCIGRNGKHQYDNMDQVMISAFKTIESIEFM